MKPHLHFMGIGGISMSGLARWYKAAGYRVSGCDSTHSPTLDDLQNRGINAWVGHGISHLTDVDTLVYNMAVSESEAELQAAHSQGIRCIKRIELLAEIFEQRQTVGITGTHGKSTTTGMVATIYIHAGLNPSVLVGASMSGIEGNMHIGTGEHLISEVDESDPGFAKLNCHTAVITNLEDDHIAGDFQERRNYHASLADLEAAMLEFANRAHHVLYCADWPSLLELFSDHTSAISYGLAEGSSYHARDVTLEQDKTTFTLCLPAGQTQTVTLAVPGLYNVQNATAAIAAAHLNGIPVEVAAAALADFRGVARRWQRWGSINNALIIDDYAHHPTEVSVTLKAAKHTGRRVRAVLQPHRWIRTARHWPALADAASIADEILVLDIYSAGELAIEGVSSQLIVDRLKTQGHEASHHSMQSALSYLEQSLADNDLIITLGAGDVWQVAAGLVAARGGDDGSA